MVTIHSSSKDARFVRLSFIGVELGSALLSGGLSIVNAGIGANASRYAAKKYLEGVESTNKANQELAREQQAWDLAQWNRQNEYNTASKQLQRWQEAGFSPFSFQGDVGNADSLQSPTLANQVAPGDLSGYAQGFSSSLAQGVQGAASAALNWREMKLRQDQLNIEKQRLANETALNDVSIEEKKALTNESKVRIDEIFQRARATEEQRYLFRAKTELAWQEWEQLGKLFPTKVREAEARAFMAEFDKVVSSQTIAQRIRQFALENEMSQADVTLKLKQAFYWEMEGREGEFNISTQPLRFDILNWQGQQMKFDLDFSKDTRYKQLKFENMLKQVDMGIKLGNLGLDIAKEVRAWVHPASYTWNYNFRNSNGEVVK